MRPPRRQPTRLPRPWDSPGKNTGAGCHFLLQCMKLKSESEVTQSCLTLATPWTAAYQAPPSMGCPRQEYWSGFPCPPPRDLSRSGIASALAGRFFTTQPPGKPEVLAEHPDSSQVQNITLSALLPLPPTHTLTPTAPDFLSQPVTSLSSSSPRLEKRLCDVISGGSGL